VVVPVVLLAQQIPLELMVAAVVGAVLDQLVVLVVKEINILLFLPLQVEKVLQVDKVMMVEPLVGGVPVVVAAVAAVLVLLVKILKRYQETLVGVVRVGLTHSHSIMN
tara:strand:+ start:93 stop:416 length:324 start_codon:yes stop_codon:yes gene_type:complete